jgi:membrane-associated phospholipid phosphatase
MEAPAARQPTFRTVEVVLAAYGAIVAVTALGRVSHAPGNWGIALAHLLIVLLMWLVATRATTPAGEVLRDVAPLVLLLGLYAALDVLSGGGTVRSHDATVLRWEEALFGGQPARDWWQRHPSHFWSTLLHGVYVSYYLLIAAPAAAFLLRRDREALRRYTRNVMCTFVVCFLVFIFWPVGGPYYQYARPTGVLVENVPAQLVYASLTTGSSFGAAFPSSHVAATTAAWISTWHGWRPLAWVLLVPVALMPVATVYTQMHYAIDAVAGVLAGILVPLAAASASPERQVVA